MGIHLSDKWCCLGESAGFDIWDTPWETTVPCAWLRGCQTHVCTASPGMVWFSSCFDVKWEHLAQQMVLFCPRISQSSYTALQSYLQSRSKRQHCDLWNRQHTCLRAPTYRIIFFKAFLVNRCFLFELVHALGCGSQIVNPQCEMFLSVQAFPCSVADSHRRCKCSVSGFRVFWSRAFAPSFEAGLFCMEQTLSRPMNAFVLQSPPAAALMNVLSKHSLEQRRELAFPPPLPFAIQGLQHCGLPSWVNIPPGKLQENNLIRRNWATYPDYSNYQGSGN